MGESESRGKRRKKEIEREKGRGGKHTHTHMHTDTHPSTHARTHAPLALSLSLSLSLSLTWLCSPVVRLLASWLRSRVQYPEGCLQAHPVVLTICGTSCIVTTKCRPVGQGGFESKRVAPEEGSPACSGGPPYHVGAVNTRGGAWSND